VRAGPRSPEHRPVGAGRRGESADVVAAVSRAMQGAEGRPRLRDRHSRLPRRHQRP
jgi:hypothetical protein